VTAFAAPWLGREKCQDVAKVLDSKRDAQVRVLQLPHLYAEAVLELVYTVGGRGPILISTSRSIGNLESGSELTTRVILVTSPWCRGWSSLRYS
jgi:hypothetical protein